MAEALRWWAVLTLLGAAAAPLSAAVLGSTPDRGYPAARVLGLLTAAYVYWLALSLGVDSRVALPAGPALLAAASGGSLLLRRGGAIRELLPAARSVAATEAVFALSFLGGCLLRAHMPDISGTEKPMEYMYLQASFSSERMPPPDLWMSGRTANYYYFGYLMHAFAARLAGVVPAVAFNLAVAAVLALTVTVLFGAVRAVLQQGGSAAWWAGAAAVLLVAGVSNPAGSIEWIRARQQDRPIDWFWAPTRVVLDNIPGRSGPQATINEFPAFSFLLGDLHPHLLSMPLIALAVTVAAVLTRAQDAGRKRLRLIPLVALLLAALYMTNTWDVPTVSVLLLLSALLGALRRGRDTVPIVAAGVLAALVAALLAGPFLASYDPPVSSVSYLPPRLSGVPLVSSLGHYVGVVWWDHTSVREFARAWGVQAALYAVALPSWLGRAARRAVLPGLATLGLAVVLAAGLKAPVLLLLPVVVLTLYGAVWADSGAVALALLLAAAGWGLVLIPELVYLRDAFEDRMNTTFKFYFQAWQLLGVADAVLVFELFRSRWREMLRWARPALALVLAAAAVLSLGYAYAGVRARSVADPTLDGTRFLRREDPTAYGAAAWLLEHAARTDTVAEATGPPYSLYARVGTFSGRPIILGWANHESQWRAGQSWAGQEIAARDRDVGALYAGTGRAEQLRVLRRYRVRFVYYGRLEREMQRQRGLTVRDPFAGWLTVAARFGDSTLYSVGPS